MTNPMSWSLRRSFEQQRAIGERSPAAAVRHQQVLCGTRALELVELALYAGSITALVGENGAGKSTLVKILTGIHQPDGGRITLCGKSVRIRSPAHARQLGISVIHQEAVVFDELSVAENIFVTARPRRWGLIDWARMRRDAGRLMERLDCPLDPDLDLRELSVAQSISCRSPRAQPRCTPRDHG